MTKAESTHEGSIAEGLVGNFREKGRLALLVDSGCAPALGLAACTCCAFLLVRSQRTRSLHHRSLRVCSVVARWLPRAHSVGLSAFARLQILLVSSQPARIPSYLY